MCISFDGSVSVNWFHISRVPSDGDVTPSSITQLQENAQKVGGALYRLPSHFSDQQQWITRSKSETMTTKRLSRPQPWLKIKNHSPKTGQSSAKHNQEVHLNYNEIIKNKIFPCTQILHFTNKDGQWKENDYSQQNRQSRSGSHDDSKQKTAKRQITSNSNSNSNSIMLSPWLLAKRFAI